MRRKFGKRVIHGSPMWLDLENQGISEALWKEGTREELDIEIVKKVVRPGMRILEVGANIGYYLLLEAKLLNGEGSIFAFEPDPRNVLLLEKNIQLNKLEKMVKIYPHAVSDTGGSAVFYMAGFSNLSSMFPRSDKDTGLEVKTVRIDDFKELEGNIDFIRMDIEGFEIEAIRGMMGLLKKNDAKILIELHKPVYTSQHHFLSTAKELFDIGYRVHYLVSSGEHSPPEIVNLGYNPVEVSHDMARSHGLYVDIKNEDFLTILEHPKKLVRSVLIGK